MKPYTDSSSLIAEPPQLRERADDEGYLYLRGVVERDEVMQLRRAICLLLEKHGWLDAGHDPNDAVTTQPARVEGQQEFWPVYDELQCMESFHALAHAPGIFRALDIVFGEPTLLHPRNIARIIFPNAVQYSTPPHQDYVHIQGTPDTWTAWIPLGDCPVKLGGLAILPGSHKLGLLPVEPMLGAGGVGIPDDLLPGEWVAGDLEAGDALLFHSHTVHRGLPNETKDRIRLSCDYRYQGRSQPIQESSLQPHHNRQTWEEIYRDWPSDRYKYYWKDLGLKTVPHDPSVYKFLKRGKEEAGRPGY